VVKVTFRDQDGGARPASGPGGFPLGAGITLADLDHDPHPFLARLRAAEPVSWLPALHGWLVTRHDLAVAVMRDSAAFTVDDPRFSTARVVGPSMLSLDGAAHGRHRGAFVKGFSRAEIQDRLAGFVVAHADRLVAAIRPDGAADLRLSERALGELWSAENLERLARTYWRFLSRVTLGLVRVRYTEAQRFVVLLCRPLTLLVFCAPEYELEADHGVVRWRIQRGLLVARAGRESKGHLQIEVRRLPERPSEGRREPSERHSGEPSQEPTEKPTGERTHQPTQTPTGERTQQPTRTPTGEPDGDVRSVSLHIEVEVANFHPAIASGLSLRLYNATQSRIHVIVTHGFLRSLARLDLAESRVGRLVAT